MLVLDTNILILYVQRKQPAVSWFEEQVRQKEAFAISAISIVELIGYSKAPDTELYEIRRVLSDVTVVDVDPTIAYAAAKIRSRHNLTTTDAIIAATAQELDVALVTLDKTFQKLLDVMVIVPQ